MSVISTLTRICMFNSISQMVKQAQRGTVICLLSHSLKVVAAMWTYVCPKQSLGFLHSRPPQVDWLLGGRTIKLKFIWWGLGEIIMEQPQSAEFRKSLRSDYVSGLLFGWPPPLKKLMQRFCSSHLMDQDNWDSETMTCLDPKKINNFPA